MTQEWFESADIEKKSAQTKSEIQPDQPETSETVETEPQASQETPVRTFLALAHFLSLNLLNFAPFGAF